LSDSLAHRPPWPPELANAFAGIQEAFRIAGAHPLSSRKALLVAVLLDNFCDRAFEILRKLGSAQVFQAPDVLAFRRCLRNEEPALGLIFDLCATAPNGPRLETRTIEVAIEAYGELSIEDYMVSLYNANTVQRVVIVNEMGEFQAAHHVLHKAIMYIGTAGPLSVTAH
jgi:hypothetical protein